MEIKRADLSSAVVRKTYPFRYGVARVDYFDGEKNVTVFMTRNGEVKFGPFKHVSDNYFEEYYGIISVNVTDFNDRTYSLTINGEELDYEAFVARKKEFSQVKEANDKNIIRRIKNSRLDVDPFSYEVTETGNIIVESPDHKFGLLDKKFNVLRKCNYNLLKYAGNGIFFFENIIQDSSYIGTMDSKGKGIKVVENSYNNVACIKRFGDQFQNGMLDVYDYFDVGVINTNLDEVISLDEGYNHIGPFTYGCCIAKKEEIKHFINDDGKVVFETKANLFEDVFHLGLVPDADVPGIYYSVNGETFDMKQFFYMITLNDETFVLIAKDRKELIYKLNQLLSKLTTKHLNALTEINSIHEKIFEKNYKELGL